MEGHRVGGLLAEGGVERLAPVAQADTAVEVDRRRAGVDATAYRDSELLSLMSDSIRLGGRNIVASTPPTALRVSGYRAVQSELRFADGVRKRYVLVFVGYVRVSVSCQWQLFQAQIAAGCASVLTSLRIGS